MTDHHTRSVLLLHELPDGSSHFDWMIERPGGTADCPASLLTFRIHVRLDQPPADHAPSRVSRFAAVRLGDHRPHYLEFEGSLTGGRGMVRRLAVARVLRFCERENEVEVTLDFGSGCRKWIGRPAAGAHEPAAPPPTWDFAEQP